MTQLFNTNNFTEGVFTIIHAKARQDRYGRPYHHFELAQGNAQLDAYDWSASCHIEQFPKELEVLASGIMRKFNKELVLDLTRLTPARLTESCQSAGEISELPGWLLKAAIEPIRVQELWAHLTLLETELLRIFVYRMMHDPRISLDFVRLSASRHHHHSEPGGLFKHAMEVFCGIHCPINMDIVEWELARVAGLLHDIGKIVTTYTDHKNPETWLADHEMAGHEVLAPHFDWLRGKDPDLLAALKYHLEWHPRHGMPLMPGALLVRYADQISAALSARKLAFQEEPDWRNLGRLETPGGTNRFYRLPARYHGPENDSGIRQLKSQTPAHIV